MTFRQRKLVVLAVWVCAVTMFGLIFTVDNPERWLVIAALAIIPVLIANRLWDEPEATLSELIAKGRSRK